MTIFVAHAHKRTFLISEKSNPVFKYLNQKTKRREKTVDKKVMLHTRTHTPTLYMKEIK